MRSKQVIFVRCYGILQDYCMADDFILTLPFTLGMRVRDIRSLAIAELSITRNTKASQQVLEQSAFATQSQMLTDDTVLSKPQILSWLPPVCGG